MKCKCPYDLYTLIDCLKYEFSDTFIAFKEYEFEFTDCLVFVTGWISEYWVSDHTWAEPPYYKFRWRESEISEVVIIFKDDHRYSLTEEDLELIEKELEKE